MENASHPSHPFSVQELILLRGSSRDSVGCIQSPLSLLVSVNFIKVKHTVKDTHPYFSFLKLVFLVIRVKVIKSEKTHKQKTPIIWK